MTIPVPSPGVVCADDAPADLFVAAFVASLHRNSL